MTKDEFRDNAKILGDKAHAGTKGGAGVVTQLRPQPPGLRPPAPWSPFGMPFMPVAVNLKPLPSVVKDKNDEAAQAGQEQKDEE